MIAAAVLLFLRRERIARWCATASAALLLCFGVLPLSTWIIQPLENAYPHPDWPARVDGILVLGGGLDATILHSRGAVAENVSMSRMVAAFEVARRYPSARLYFAGGSWNAVGDKNAESVAAEHIFGQLGLPAGRLVLENKSRNTWENIQFTKAAAKPRPGEVWLLATSAYHMPRAMWAAQRAGWTMVPWPTDYLTAREAHYSFGDITGNLEHTDRGLKEWLGLLAYHLKA
jgi:uncharacterized SAM-binding protein YcdF (DUF218 family)